MKIAILNDTLDEFGGAERVALTMLRMFPDADFFTSFANPTIVRKFFTGLTPHLHTPWQILSFLATHRSLMQMISPALWGHWNLSGYDLVLSNPSDIMCNMVSVTRGTHIQYIHTIPKNLFGLLPKTPLQRFIGYDTIVSPRFHRAIRNTPHILTSSKHMQQTIRRTFGVTAHVLPPPVHIPRTPPRRSATPGFYLCVSRLDREKHLELAVEACTALSLPLNIVGVTNEPRYETHLRSIAGPTVRFLGYRSDAEVHRLYERAIAFLFPSKREDFGIAPLEALAHGVPVIAYYGGGPKETLVEGKTGTFFRKHTTASLIDAIRRLPAMNLHPNELYTHARQYSEEVFQRKLHSYIRQAIKQAEINSRRKRYR